MKKVTDYEILSNTDSFQLVEEVNQRFKEGWTLNGRAYCRYSDEMWFQPMIKEVEVDEKKEVVG